MLCYQWYPNFITAETLKRFIKLASKKFLLEICLSVFYKTLKSPLPLSVSIAVVKMIANDTWLAIINFIKPYAT